MNDKGQALVELDEWIAQARALIDMLEPLREQHKGKNWAGVVACPYCESIFPLIHTRNGMFYGMCSNDKCLASIGVKRS